MTRRSWGGPGWSLDPAEAEEVEDLPTPDVLRQRIELADRAADSVISVLGAFSSTGGQMKRHCASALARLDRHGSHTFLENPDVDGDVCDFDAGPWPCPDYLDLSSEYPA